MHVLASACAHALRFVHSGIPSCRTCCVNWYAHWNPPAYGRSKHTRLALLMFAKAFVSAVGNAGAIAVLPLVARRKRRLFWTRRTSSTETSRQLARHSHLCSRLFRHIIPSNMYRTVHGVHRQVIDLRTQLDNLTVGGAATCARSVVEWCASALAVFPGNTPTYSHTLNLFVHTGWLARHPCAGVRAAHDG